MRTKYPSRDLAGSINIRLPSVIMDDLETLSVKFDLEKSEICRRAIKEGLKAFHDAKLPGATE